MYILLSLFPIELTTQLDVRRRRSCLCVCVFSFHHEPSDFCGVREEKKLPRDFLEIIRILGYGRILIFVLVKMTFDILISLSLLHMLRCALFFPIKLLTEDYLSVMMIISTIENEEEENQTDALCSINLHRSFQQIIRNIHIDLYTPRKGERKEDVLNEQFIDMNDESL